MNRADAQGIKPIKNYRNRLIMVVFLVAPTGIEPVFHA